MADHQDLAAGMESRDIGGHILNPLRDLQDGLSTGWPSGQRRSLALRPVQWEPCLDLGPQQAVPLAMVDLAKTRVQADEQPELCCQRIRRLPGTQQITGVEGVEWPTRQASGQLRCLEPACFVQTGVRLSLETSRDVPIGLAMPDQPEMRGQESALSLAAVYAGTSIMGGRSNSAMSSTTRR